MSDHPELYYWLYLLPIALIAFWAIRYIEGKVKPSDLLSHTFGAGFVYYAFWYMGLFRLLVYPVMLAVFGFFVWALFRAKVSSKVIAGVMMGLFLLSGLYAYQARARNGAYWELYKVQDPGSSFGWLANAAKDRRFTRPQLLRYAESKDALVRKNARHIAVLQGVEESNAEEAEAFYKALEEIDQTLAQSYYQNLDGELQLQLDESLGLRQK